MPHTPDAETILWVTRKRGHRADPGLAFSLSEPESRTSEAARAADRIAAAATTPSPNGTPAPERPAYRHRLATALFLGAATACFLAALVTTATIHFLFVQEHLDGFTFVLLVALAQCFGLLGWQLLSILRTALRRALGVEPDADADVARPASS